jgi:6-pyruvoyltetrahydropterin/6-carboxytetrahydropterin synthase
VIDFSVIKEKLCMWIENEFDHKTLIWKNDPMLQALQEISRESIVVVPFNPTAENIAEHLVTEIAPALLEDTGIILLECRVEETRKCSAVYRRGDKE